MSKRIVESLIILGINLATGVLLLAAFFFFLFKGDPILAAVPAVLAAPAILVQPWFVLFVLLPGSPLLAPLCTTVVSVPLYVFLDRRGGLDRAKIALGRLMNRRGFMIVGGIIVGAVALGFARYVDFPALHRGLPPTLQHPLKDTNLTLANPRYYCLGSFIDSEWLWQARISERDLSLLGNKLNTHPVAANRIGDAFWSMPPCWWRPTFSERVRVFATVDFPIDGRGPDGWHALATWSPEDGVLHMWIKDNF